MRPRAEKCEWIQFWLGRSYQAHFVQNKQGTNCLCAGTWGTAAISEFCESHEEPHFN